MATSGRIEANVAGAIFWLNWQLAGQDIAGNFSDVHWQAGLTTGATRYYSNAVKIIGGGIGGEAIGTGTWSNHPPYTTKQYLAGTKRMHHANDGTLAFYADITGWVINPAQNSAGAWFELPRIPRQSNPTFSKDVYTVGERIVVNMNRKANFTHKGSVQIPDENIIMEFRDQTDAWGWTPDEAKIDEIYRRMANTVETSLGVDITTWNGGTQIGGTGWQNKKIRVDTELVRPDFSNFTFSNDAKTQSILGNSTELIQGVSTLTATISTAQKMTTKRHATAKNYTVIFDGQTKELTESTEALTFSNFESSSSGDLLIRTIARDSRNLTREVSKTVKVHAYSSPQIQVEAKRQNNFDQTTKVQISGNYTALNGKNHISSLKYRWRETGGSFNDWQTLMFSQNNGNLTVSPQYLSLNSSGQFEIEVQAIDKIGTTATATTTVDRGVPLLMISSNKEKVGVNKVPELGDLDVKGDIYAGGKIVLTEANLPKSVEQGHNERWTYQSVPVGYGFTATFYKANGIVNFFINGQIGSYGNATMGEKIPEKFRPTHSSSFSGICINSNNHSGGFILIFHSDGTIQKRGTSNHQEYHISGSYIAKNF